MTEFNQQDFKDLYDHLGEEGAVHGEFFGMPLHTKKGEIRRGISIIFEALRRAAEEAPATQPWVHKLSKMQQSVLLSAIRGCDGVAKFHKHKALVKWFRRCVLISAFDGVAITDAFAPGGGSFTGPIADNLHGPMFLALPADKQQLLRSVALQKVSDDFASSRDELPAHYTTHFMHAAEIIGYKHPDLEIRAFWYGVYERLVHTLHCWPETEAQMDLRLGDNEAQWRARGDDGGSCSD